MNGAEHIPLPVARAETPLHWWRDWVGLNALGELIGLAIPMAVAALWATRTSALAFASLMVVAGTLEGVVVGYAQWRVLRRPFSALAAASWVKWTALGAAVAWALGMIPSVLMHETSHAQTPDFGEMTTTTQLLLAALTGLVLGPVLGVPQWFVLRRHIDIAAWWIPANSLAWAFGMPVVFLGAGAVPADSSPVQLAAIGAVTLAAAGAVVGAVHGLMLLWLLRASLTSSRRDVGGS